MDKLPLLDGPYMNEGFVQVADKPGEWESRAVAPLVTCSAPLDETSSPRVR
jgi:hypothetical protein